MRRSMLLVIAVAQIAWVVPSQSLAEPKSAASLDSVRGQGCYTYGDDDTPAKAKKASLALARENAVTNYRVYVQSASTVRNFQLEDDVIQSASAGILQDVQIDKQEQKDREVCTAITAKINPVKLEDLIKQQTQAKDLAQTAETPLLAGGSSFGVKVWTNTQDGRFVEGESLVISVQSDKDGYLKLDYYQADGTVVHLVPNVFGGEAFVKAGQVYAFGGPGSRETFTVQGPFGAETIKALVSTQPFAPSFATTSNVDDSRRYLGTLKAATRGVKVGDGSGAAQWAEAATTLTTASKAVSEHTGTRGVKKKG